MVDGIELVSSFLFLDLKMEEKMMNVMRMLLEYVFEF